MSKRRRYRPAGAGTAVGARRAPSRWWRSRRVCDVEGSAQVLVTFGCPPGEAYLIDRLPPPLPPMAVMTRPQDWAPAARSILWPDAVVLEHRADDYVRRVARDLAERRLDPRSVARITGI